VENRATADKLSNKAINCVTQSVIVNLQKTPQATVSRSSMRKLRYLWEIRPTRAHHSDELSALETK
jgi:hypothetical protein